MYHYYVLLLILLQYIVCNEIMMLKGLLVIPGLGRADRLDTVINNLRLLYNSHFNKAYIDWNCVVYVYAPREDALFWSNTIQLEELYSTCNVVESTNKKVTENLYMLQPALIKDSTNIVFLLLDDIKILSHDYFDLNGIINTMVINKLTIASPLINGANKGGGQKFRNIMQTEAVKGTEGYVSNFVEIFAWVMTVPAYTALWELLCPSVNPYAWGYDFWYNGYAKQRVPGHKMGIISTSRVKHEQGSIELGRTDNTAVSVKWNAVLAQERHYKRFKNIDLAYYRNHLDLANASWNGAVTDYLHPITKDNNLTIRDVVSYFSTVDNSYVVNTSNYRKDYSASKKRSRRVRRGEE